MLMNPTFRDDLALLLELNREYIRCVQASDAKRFEQILRKDFLCSNPDGSLLNREEFLKQVRDPIRISNLQASEVNVRILGDIAIIHARTTYVMPDGKFGHGRYTDVWARANESWLAVSAHVTRR